MKRIYSLIILGLFLIPKTGFYELNAKNVFELSFENTVLDTPQKEKTASQDATVKKAKVSKNTKPSKDTEKTNSQKQDGNKKNANERKTDKSTNIPAQSGGESNNAAEVGDGTDSNNNISNSSSDNGEIVNSTEGVSVQGLNDSIQNLNNTIGEMKSLSTIKQIAFFILAFVVLIILIYLFNRINTTNKALNISKRRIDELLNSYDNISSQLRAYNNEVDILQKKVREFENTSNANSYNGNSLGINMNGQYNEGPGFYRKPAEPIIRNFYLGAPTNDGFFSSCSQSKGPDSIYKLITSDGKNGNFIFINEIDCIQTAILSITTLIKPACQINNSGVRPEHVTTNREGTAVFENGRWRITCKAVITFE